MFNSKVSEARAYVLGHGCRSQPFISSPGTAWVGVRGGRTPPAGDVPTWAVETCVGQGAPGLDTQQDRLPWGVRATTQDTEHHPGGLQGSVC